MDAISDVATDPKLIDKVGRNGRLVVNGSRSGIDIRVVKEKTGSIVTGFPTNVPRNP